VILLLSVPAWSSAGTILVLGNTADQATAGVANQLEAAGFNVVVSGSYLSNYSPYDEVWDLNYGDPNLNQNAAFKTYLQQGGRMFIEGEWSAFDSRNTAIVNFVSSIGGGTLTLVGDENGTNYQDEPITAAGQVVNSPNVVSSVYLPGDRTVSITNSGSSDGFLVTHSTHPGQEDTGSVVGWNFGGISSSPGARLLVSFDSDFYRYSPGWVADMGTYLDGPRISPVPAPSTLMLILTGLPTGCGLCFLRRPPRTLVR
jgi:hypothetical protein